MTSARVQIKTKRPVGAAKMTNDQARSLRSHATAESVRANRTPPKIVGVTTGSGITNLRAKRTSKSAAMPNPRMPRMDFGRNFIGESFYL